MRRFYCRTLHLKLATVSIDIVRSLLLLLTDPKSPVPMVYLLDWAYLERWCRDLTLSFSDVYVFTIPLYLPIRDVDGKYRVVRAS